MTDQPYVYAGVGWWRGGPRGGAFRLALGGCEDTYAIALRLREAGMPGFSLPHGESQGINRDPTGVIADYAFAMSHLLTRPEVFSEGRQGNFDDGLTTNSG
jgi:hypothetical protein